METKRRASVTIDSSEEDVLQYLQDRCGSMISAYPSGTFLGIDGEVFLGLSPDTIDLTLPDLSVRDKGLLLARIETLRSAKTPPLSPTREAATPPQFDPSVTPKSAVRSVTPPRTFSRLPPLAVSRDERPISKLDDDRYTSLYAESFSPKRASSPTRRAPASRIVPLLGELPRVLVEVYRTTDDPEKDEFVGESWLPDLREFEFKPSTLRLALRRSVKRTDSRLIQARAWMGALTATAKYQRLENKIDLQIMEAKELNFAGNPFVEIFAKIFVFTSPTLTLVYETKRSPLDRTTSVHIDEQISITFALAGEGVGFIAASSSSGLGPVSAVSPTHAPSPATKPEGPVIAASMFKQLMLRTDDASGRDKLTLQDLLTFSANGEQFKLSPRFNRFEAFLLPTHEVSALFGSEFTLRSVGQIDALKADSDYMRSQSQIVDLLLAAWEESWESDTWLLRHALLSCVLMGNKEATQRLTAFAKSLSKTRQANMGEDGFGEAVFTLLDESSAQTFWTAPTRRSGIRSPHLPGQRMSLGQLIRFSQDHR